MKNKLLLGWHSMLAMLFVVIWHSVACALQPPEWLYWLITIPVMFTVGYNYQVILPKLTPKFITDFGKEV
jgi:hypothetical protein